jgi:hypothetical protein
VRRDQQNNLAAGLSGIGAYPPKIVRVDPLPMKVPVGPAGHETVYKHVFRLLFNTTPRQPASDFALCAEDYALTLLYMAVKWPYVQVFGNLDLAEEEGVKVVRVPPQYRPAEPVLRNMAEMLPLSPRRRVCFTNGRLWFGQPVDPAIEANELLVVFYDDKRVVTIYAAEMID